MAAKPPDEGLTSLGLHGAVYAVGNVLSRLGGFILLPLYLRMLTPEEYGVLEMFYVTSAILGVFVSGGFSQGALRFYFDFEREADRKAVITTALAAAGGLSGLAAVLLWPFADPAGRLLAGTSGYASSFQLVLLTLVVQMTSEVGLSYFRARNYSGKFVAASVGKLVLQVVINVITVAKLGWGVPGVLLGNLLGAAASGVVVVGITMAECGRAYRHTVLVAMLRYTYPMVLAGVAGVVLERADRFILQHASGLDAVGVYALGDKLAMILAIGFLQPFRTAYGAYRFSVIKSVNREVLQRRVLRYYLVVACFFGLALTVPAPTLLRMLSNEAYWGAAVVLPVLVFKIVLGGAEYVFQSGILFAKKTRYSMIITIVTGLMRVGITLALVRRLGLMAPAYAGVAAALVAAIAMARVSRRFDPVDWDLPALGKITAIVGVCLAVGLPAGGGPVGSLAVVLAFPVLCVATRVITPGEIAAAWAAVAERFRGMRRAGAG